MKSLKNLLLAKSIVAAAVAGSGIAAPTVSHAIAVGGPVAGVSCRAGYNPNFNGTSLTCTKPGAAIVLALKCLNPTFPNFVMRAGGPGNKGDHDLCTRRPGSPGAAVITANGSLAGLTEGQDYVYAELDAAELATQANLRGQAEAASLGVPSDQVATLTNPSVVVRNGGAGGRDRVDTSPVFYTLPVQAFGGVINPPVVISTPFAPRPLP